MAKKYKCRVEYLESTGTQWIDTGVNVDTSTDEIKLYFQLNETQNYKWLFGEYDNNARIGLGSGDGTDKRNFLYQQTATKVSDTQMYNTQHLFEINSNGGFLNGTKIRDYLSFASTATIYLFNLNIDSASDYRCKGKIWGYRHKRNGVLILDLIPVLDLSGKPAMYDQVSGKLFYNKGTGEFAYGRQIIPVEYLYTGDDINCESSAPFTSTSYRLIDTKETIDLTSVVEIKFAFDKNIYYSGCGLRNNSSNMTQSVYFPACYSTQDKFGWTIGSGEEQRQKFTLDTDDHIIRVDLPKTNVTWDGVVYPISNLTYTPSERTFPLFAFSDARATQDNGYRFPMQGKIYYAKFWKNGVLTKDFIPCIDENLTPFMFDLVTNTCYLNEGTGQFKVGPNVEKVWGSKKLRRKLALALANLKKKRKYYCEVEYIESTTTTTSSGPYIDTGIEALDTTSFMINFSFNNTAYGQGMGEGYLAGKRFSVVGIYTSGGSTYFGYAYNSWYDTDVAIDTNRHTFELDAYNKKYYLDNHTYNIPNVSYTSEGKTIGLFCRICNNNGTTYPNWFCAGKMYGARIKQNGILVRDFIPVLDWNMTPCMYDRVTEQLFYNAGSRNFTAGREIHPVDYLESTGVEYIDTGIKFDGANTKIELKTYEDSLTRRHSICGDDGNFFYYFRGTGNWAVGYNGTAANIDSYMSVGDNVFVMDKNNVYVNGVLAKTYTASSNVSSYNALLFNRKTSLVDNGAVTMYYCKMWNNDVLVRDYIPAIDENDTFFMFDKVSHTAYNNAGSGSFIGPTVAKDEQGKIVEPEYE